MMSPGSIRQQKRSNGRLRILPMTNHALKLVYHRNRSTLSCATAAIEANKLLLASHHISRTAATPSTTVPSPSKILGLSISSSRSCPSVQVSHPFDPFEIEEFASGLTGGRACSDTDPTPKPCHGSALKRVDRELTPFPDFKGAWSATKVHQFVWISEIGGNYGRESSPDQREKKKKKIWDFTLGILVVEEGEVRDLDLKNLKREQQVFLA